MHYVHLCRDEYLPRLYFRLVSINAEVIDYLDLFSEYPPSISEYSS